jgi:hypothetical protein
VLLNGSFLKKWIRWIVAYRTKTNKKTFGKCTTTIRKWYAKLPQRKQDEAEKVTKKWNDEGAPNKENMLV